MRLGDNERITLKQAVLSCLPEARVYLFGSRVDHTRKGGDIDLLVIGDRVLTLSEKARIHFSFESHFGAQKLDIASMTHEEDTPFKKIALTEAVLL